jgi:hypothetical protein
MIFPPLSRQLGLSIEVAGVKKLTSVSWRPLERIDHRLLGLRLDS